MEGFNERIEGLSEIEARLRELSRTAAHRIVKAGVMEGGQVLRAAIAERAPERPELPSGTAIPPGALRHDIELHFGLDPQGLPAAIVAPGHYTAHAARWVEYGHRLVRGGYNRVVGNSTKGPGQQVGNVKAYPFIRPGFEAARGAAVAAAIAKIREGLAQWAKKR